MKELGEENTVLNTEQNNEGIGLVNEVSRLQEGAEEQRTEIAALNGEKNEPPGRP